MIHVKQFAFSRLQRMAVYWSTYGKHPRTIYALSTAAGRAAIAVIRMSGPAAGDALVALIGSKPSPRQAKLATLRHPSTHAPLDQALVLYFEGPVQ